MEIPELKNRLSNILPSEIDVSEEVLEELSSYLESPYITDEKGEMRNLSSLTLPLEDEPHIERWSFYLDESVHSGIPAIRVLSRYIPQLRYPVEEGISNNIAYKISVRKGNFSSDDCETDQGVEYSDLNHLSFNNAAGINLSVEQTPSGKLPVIQTSDREDFITLVRVFTGRNEPVNVPDSMGACMIKGFNNWDRIHQLKADFIKKWQDKAENTDEFENISQSETVGESGKKDQAKIQEDVERAWKFHFTTTVKPDKTLYQDTFMLVSDGPYSAVSAEEAGLTDVEWREKSIIIRREHELTHYFARRVYGTMRNNALDEIIGDLTGTCAAFGFADRDLMLAFLGLKSFPPFTHGGRLANYLGDPPLSAKSFEVLCYIVCNAVDNFSSIFKSSDSGSGNFTTDITLMSDVLKKLFSFSLVDMASPDFQNKFDK